MTEAEQKCHPLSHAVFPSHACCTKRHRRFEGDEEERLIIPSSQSALSEAQEMVEDQLRLPHTHYEHLPPGRQYKVPRCTKLLNSFKN